MFARIKRSGQNEYLQIVENHREGKRVAQRVITTLGRLDELKAGGDLQALTKSLARFSEKTLMVLSGCVFRLKWPPVLIKSGRLFRLKPATQYDESGHPDRSRQATLVLIFITLIFPPV